MSFLKNIFWNQEEARLRMVWRLVVWVVPFIVCFTALGFLDVNLAGSLPESPISEGASILFPVEVLIAFLVSVWITGRFIDRRRFADFGFRLGPAWWADLGFGLALGALLTAGIFLIERAAGWVTVVGFFRTRMEGASFPTEMLLVLVTFVSVGISEELWNRGYLIKNLAEGLNVKPLGPKGGIVLAALITAVAFGLLHMTNPHASVISTVALMIAGLLYATAYVLTGELAIPIGYHITWNLFESSVFGFSVSGLDLGTTFIALHQGGPDLWTGGPFGPEAGLLGIGARLVGILLIVGWVWLRRGRVRLHEGLATPDRL